MKKPTPRRRRRQASPSPDDSLKTFLATAAKEGLVNGRFVLVPVGSGLRRLPAPSAGFEGRVISASKGRFRPRAFGKLWYAQAAIDALHPHPSKLPEHVNYLQLTRDVNKQLKKNPEYHLGELDQMTVRRALAVRAANSDPRAI